ncbi:MAG: S8 family serine peptidase, partial [Blastocatellia bacterium]|nr:S8 family serine peptidase [Blastocatellia bacterium]
IISLRAVRAEKPAPIKPAGKPQPVTMPHKEGEIIVKFKQDAPQSLRDLVVRTYAGNEKRLRGRSGLSKLKIKDGLDLSNTIFTLKQLNAVVEYAEPNYLVTRAGAINRHRHPKQYLKIPNDSRFNLQWALSNTGRNNSGSDIGALAGWQYTTGSEKTIIAVIDTGVDIRHPDLWHNIWANKQEHVGKKGEDDDRDGYIDDISGWNFVNDSNDVTDDNGHGTAMAGIIAAEGNNSEGITGVMWRASIMPLKALDSTGSGTIFDVVEAIDFAATHGASVINCSFGTDGYSQALLDAINRAEMSGALVVTSTGNGGRDLSQKPYYPASYTAGNLITVAATAGGDQLADFSNWSESQVQIAAPGIDILTTSPNGEYASVTGTSAAAPLVAGVAGLLKTIRGWTSAQTVKQALIDGARKSDFLRGKVLSGGLISADRAIDIFTKPRAVSGLGTVGVRRNSGEFQPDGFNLEYLRNHRPHRANVHQMKYMSDYRTHRIVNRMLRPARKFSIKTPQVTSSGGPGNPKNAVGRPGSVVGREGDPTIASSATGGQSVIFGSQNINFSAPVLSLGGRGGLGLDLTLSYNSNSVWLNENYQGPGRLFFNYDMDFSPGWKLGFGKLIGAVDNNFESLAPIYDPDLGVFYYTWVEPDGTRRTLLATSSNNIFRSNDSSNLELEITGTGATALLKLGNGTQISLSYVTGVAY